MAEAALFMAFSLQGLAMSADELYFHRGRELRRWERLGHPLDTLVYGCCFAFLCVATPSEHNLWIYAALAIGSCLLITKDEWQHKELCAGVENWLHSILFILHPVVLIAAGVVWWQGGSQANLQIISSVIGVFFIYQLIYWNVWRRDQQRIL